MSEVVIVYAVFGDSPAAEAAARRAVEQELAACANILAPCTSLCRWEGELTMATEVPVMFKTSRGRRDALIADLANGHAYQIPAILAWDADGAHGPFADWVAGQTRGG